MFGGTDKAECESVTEARELVESSVNQKTTIKLSDEFLKIFKTTFEYLKVSYSRGKSKFGKKEYKTMEKQMNKLYGEVTNLENATLYDIAALAYSYQHLCHTLISSDKKDLRIAKDLILRCFNLVKDRELDPKFILIALKAHYNLASIYEVQNKKDKVIQICKRAVELYLTYTHEDEMYGCPIDLTDIIINSVLDGYFKLKLVYRNNLNLLVNTYTELGQIYDDNFMTYSHLLQATEFCTLNSLGEYILWVAKTLIICNYLIKCGRIIEAENHLATAQIVKKYFIDKKYNKMRKKKPYLELLEETDMIGKIETLLVLYLVKYSLATFRRSTERLLRLEKEDEDIEINNLKSEHPTTSKGQVSQRLLVFKEMDRGYPFPGELTIRLISNSDPYRSFFYLLFHLNNWRSDIDPEMDIGTYVELILNTSNVYKYMAFYEKDRTSKILLQNRYVDVLSEAVKKEIFCIYPHSLSHMRLRLAISYSTLIDVKFENLDADHLVYMPQSYNTIMFEVESLVRNALTNLKLNI